MPTKLSLREKIFLKLTICLSLVVLPFQLYKFETHDISSISLAVINAIGYAIIFSLGIILFSPPMQPSNVKNTPNDISVQEVCEGAYSVILRLLAFILKVVVLFAVIGLVLWILWPVLVSPLTWKIAGGIVMGGLILGALSAR